MCLEQYITGSNSKPKKCCPHIPQLLLQSTFQYYPSIKGYDFQKRDLMGMDVILCGYALSSAENSRLPSQSFIRRFGVWNNSGVIEIRVQSIHKRFSTRINSIRNVTKTKSGSRTLHFVQSVWLLSALVTTVPALLVFYSITLYSFYSLLFYVYITAIKITSLGK